MSGTVVPIVITRLSAGKGDGNDEFVHDWNTPSNAERRKGVLFEVTEDVKLLLVHGHNKLRPDKISAAIDEAVEEIEKEDSKKIDLSSSDTRVFVLVHGFERENYDFNNLFKRNDIEFSLYSLVKGDLTTPSFRDALKQKGIDEKVCDAIIEKCRNPARLQILYLNQIRTLLLALQLNVAVAKKKSVSEELREPAKKYTQRSLEEIEKCVQYPVIQKLKVSTKYQRIFLIWDITNERNEKEDSQRAFIDDETKIQWGNKEFWEQCSKIKDIRKINIDKLLDTLDDEEGFKQDIQNINKEVKSLLTQVGVQRSDSNAGS